MYSEYLEHLQHDCTNVHCMSVLMRYMLYGNRSSALSMLRCASYALWDAYPITGRPLIPAVCIVSGLRWFVQRIGSRQVGSVCVGRVVFFPRVCRVVFVTLLGRVRLAGAWTAAAGRGRARLALVGCTRISVISYMPVNETQKNINGWLTYRTILGHHIKSA